MVFNVPPALASHHCPSSVFICVHLWFHPIMELGDEIGPVRRVAPDRERVARYVGSVSGTQQLFVDEDYARGLGFHGTIVPGPMLSALLEQFLRAALPGWRLQRLSISFRLPTVVGHPLTLSGVITEHHEQAGGRQVVCELIIEHADGERAVTGTATLSTTSG
jgi:acyl dehydratase